MEMSFLSGSTFRRRAIRVLFIFLVLIPYIAGAQEERAFEILDERGEIVFEFYPEDPSVLTRLNSFLSVDLKTALGYVAYANIAGFRSFLNYNIPYTIIENGSGKKSMPDIIPFPGEWNVYPSHMQYVSFMEDIARNYPDIARLDTIGLSVEGRQILVMKITDNPDQREPEPAFVYSSTMHGDETTGFVLLLRLIGYLCSNYGTEPGVTRLVDELEIWINPLANPDGAYWQGDSMISVPKRFNSNNADLNRNFPGIINGENPDGMNYQPETLSQMDFLSSIYMVMGANIHSGTEVVNYPYDAREILHADNQWYIETSREYAEAAQTRSFPVLYMSGFDDGITNGWEWYFADGTRQDWVNYYNHAREVTIEISQEKDPSPADLPFFWHYNCPSMLRYMEQSLYGIHGIIRSKSNGEPLKADILVRDHDGLHSNIFSDSLTGFFARPIEEGIFNLEISSLGHESKLIPGVMSGKDQTAWLEVELAPLEAGLADFHGAEGPLSAYFSGNDLILTGLCSGPHTISIYDLNGSLVMEIRKNFGGAGIYSYSPEGQILQPGIYLLKVVSPDGIQTRKIFKSE